MDSPKETGQRKVRFVLACRFLKGYLQAWRREKFGHQDLLPWPGETPRQRLVRIINYGAPKSTWYLILEGAIEWVRQMVILAFWTLTILSLCIPIFFGKELALFNWPLLFHDLFTRLLPYIFQQLFTRGIS